MERLSTVGAGGGRVGLATDLRHSHHRRTMLGQVTQCGLEREGGSIWNNRLQ